MASATVTLPGWTHQATLTDSVRPRVTAPANRTELPKEMDSRNVRRRG